MRYEDYERGFYFDEPEVERTGPGFGTDANADGPGWPHVDPIIKDEIDTEPPRV